MTAPVQEMRADLTVDYGTVLTLTVEAASLAAVLDAAEAMAKAGHGLMVALVTGDDVVTAMALWDAALARWRELTGEDTP